MKSGSGPIRPSKPRRCVPGVVRMTANRRTHRASAPGRDRHDVVRPRANGGSVVHSTDGSLTARPARLDPEPTSAALISLHRGGRSNPYARTRWSPRRRAHWLVLPVPVGLRQGQVTFPAAWLNLRCSMATGWVGSLPVVMSAAASTSSGRG